MEEFVGFDAKLPETLIPIGSSTNVLMVTWVTPHEFYVQMKSYEKSFAEMSARIQEIYKKRLAVTAVPASGSVVVVMHDAAKSFKRAKIVDYNPSLGKFKADLIDYGSRIICTQKHIYELEKSLIGLPALAIRCSLIEVIRNKSREEIQSQLIKYLPDGKPMRCLFFRLEGDVSFVEFSAGEVDLKEAMIKDGLISAVPQGE